MAGREVGGTARVGGEGGAPRDVHLLAAAQHTPGRGSPAAANLRAALSCSSRWRTSPLLYQALGEGKTLESGQGGEWWLEQST